MKDQIKIFAIGLLAVICVVCVGISAVCAFIEGYVFTIVAGVITLALGIFGFIRFMKYLDEQDKKK